jgi:hypothetical protein
MRRWRRTVESRLLRSGGARPGPDQRQDPAGAAPGRIVPGSAARRRCPGANLRSAGFLLRAELGGLPPGRVGQRRPPSRQDVLFLELRGSRTPPPPRPQCLPDHGPPRPAARHRAGRDRAVPIRYQAQAAGSARFFAVSAERRWPAGSSWHPDRHGAAPAAASPTTRPSLPTASRPPGHAGLHGAVEARLRLGTRRAAAGRCRPRTRGRGGRRARAATRPHERDGPYRRRARPWTRAPTDPGRAGLRGRTGA